jgi:hypothetical protein
VIKTLTGQSAERGLKTESRPSSGDRSSCPISAIPDINHISPGRWKSSLLGGEGVGRLDQPLGHAGLASAMPRIVQEC